MGGSNIVKMSLFFENIRFLSYNQIGSLMPSEASIEAVLGKSCSKFQPAIFYDNF